MSSYTPVLSQQSAQYSTRQVQSQRPMQKTPPMTKTPPVPGLQMPLNQVSAKPMMMSPDKQAGMPPTYGAVPAKSMTMPPGSKVGMRPTGAAVPAKPMMPTGTQVEMPTPGTMRSQLEESEDVRALKVAIEKAKDKLGDLQVEEAAPTVAPTASSTRRPSPAQSDLGDTGATREEYRSTLDDPLIFKPVQPRSHAAPSSVGAFEKVVIIVKGRVMHLYSKVGDKLVHIQVKLMDSYEAARSKAFGTLAMLKSASQTYQFRLIENVKVIKAKVTDRVTLLYSKANNSSYNFKLMLQTKTLESYNRAKIAVQKLPLPMVVKNSFINIHRQLSSLSVNIKNGCMHIYGQIGAVAFRIRTRFVHGADAVKAKAIELVSRVTKVLEKQVNSFRNGVSFVRCKVGDATLYVSNRIVGTKNLAQAKVAQTYARMKRAVIDLPVTSKIVDGINFIKNKAGDMVIYVKDGYIHVTSKVGETLHYMKAKVVEANGVVQIKIIEKYSGTRAMIESIASTAKTNALSAAEIAKIKVRAATDYTKQFAADKPVASSAATGAVLLGTGGGAAGLAAGGAAGAAAGLPLALFTFGLSIPVGAIIGGGAGACVGASAGGAAGAIGGGAAGYTYDHRTQIKDGMDSVAARASSLRSRLVKRA